MILLCADGRFLEMGSHDILISSECEFFHVLQHHRLSYYHLIMYIHNLFGITVVRKSEFDVKNISWMALNHENF